MGGGPASPPTDTANLNLNLNIHIARAPPAPATMDPKPNKIYRVLVTGMGASHSQNSSWRIAALLPRIVLSKSPFNATELPIEILTPSEPVKTEYAHMRRWVAEESRRGYEGFDAIVHLGMASGWEWYALEERAFGEAFSSTFFGSGKKEYSTEENNESRELIGCRRRRRRLGRPPYTGEEGYYLVPDDSGRTVRDLTPEEGKGRWASAPVGLVSTVDVERAIDDVDRALLRSSHARSDEEQDAARTEDAAYEAITGIPGSSWTCDPSARLDGAVVETEPQETMPEKEEIPDVRSHFEAGNSACGFLYYESLAQCWERKLHTKVLFCHVPGWQDDARLQTGRDVICAVVGAVCAQITK